MTIYLDYAAATPLDGRVLTAMRPYFAEAFFNPAATYTAARRVREAVDAARAVVAGVLGARPTDILFTAGGTEANNLALHGIMQQYPGKKLLVSAVEHESVISVTRAYTHAVVPVRADGLIDLEALRNQVDDETVLISVMYANNEVGTIQPLREVAAVARQVLEQRRRAGNTLPLYLHTDATQAANYLDLHVSRLGVDLMTLNGGKIYGPKQSGVLYVRSGVTLRPLLLGGGQERGYRSGTENVPGIVGFSKALEIAQDMRSDEVRRIGELQRLFFALLEEKIPTAIINGSRKKRLPNNVHVTLPGHDNERLLMALDEAGIMAAAGSACAASDEEPSHVLRAMGIAASDAQSSLRFTLGRGTTEQDIRAAVDILHTLVA